MSIKERTHPRGTIFKFPGYNDYFMLAQVGDKLYNLISLNDGCRKTNTWECNNRINGIEIPEYTWLNGGPPKVIFSLTNRYNDVLPIIEEIKDNGFNNGLNRKLIKKIAEMEK